ncbi:MAG: riboflavin synthase, partial [Gammaproteobacteria bacterium]|nr:riboflavin synthase [Gammaproteobacteria bacterium]
EVGGHILSGHVTATAELMAKKVEGHDHVLHFALDQSWLKYVFHKGFIALDGASLTVSSLDRQASMFTVSLIPETLARTTLGQLKVGDSVNVEVDSQTLATVETVERIVQDPAWREQFATSDAG